MASETTPLASTAGAISEHSTDVSVVPRISPYFIDQQVEDDIGPTDIERGVQVPPIRRSKTFTENTDSNLNLQVSINNPVNLSRRLSAFPGSDYGELFRRVNSLKVMRPLKLIGHVKRLIDWKKYRMSDEDVEKIKNRKLKDFYTEQNDMIDRYEDIDMLLDTGVQLEMIQNYADNTSTDTSVGVSSDEEIPIAPSYYGQPDTANQNMNISNSNSNSNSNESSNSGNSQLLTIPKGQKLKRSNSVDTRSSHSSKRGSLNRTRHIQLSAVPGNIDLEGAKILGTPHESTSAIVKWAIYFNFALNVVLLFGKIVVVYMTNSLSLVASLVDSVLDFMSTLIIFFANKYAAKRSSRFPVGRKQLEPIGVLIFSIVIILSFAQVLIESFKQLFGNDEEEVVTLSNTAIIIMVTTIGTKFFGYELCKNINNSSVQALVEDAKTDIVFNTFSLIFPLFGVLFNIWWIDALGASILCFYVIVQWAMVTFEHIDHLSGSNASKAEYQQVLYMIFRFTDEISKVKNYRMYHMGDQVNVEVDIVLRNHRMSMKDCHDLGESLQYTIETLPYVNRCFVHIDYKVRNYVGHLTG